MKNLFILACCLSTLIFLIVNRENISCDDKVLEAKWSKNSFPISCYYKKNNVLFIHTYNMIIIDINEKIGRRIFNKCQKWMIYTEEKTIPGSSIFLKFNDGGEMFNSKLYLDKISGNIIYAEMTINSKNTKEIYNVMKSEILKILNVKNLDMLKRIYY